MNPVMPDEIRILAFERSQDDWAAVEQTIAAGLPQATCVHTADPDALLALLAPERWHCILAGCASMEAAGVSCTETVYDRGANAPLILLADLETEALALEQMREGATDYVLNGGLQRLIPAIRREAARAEVARQRAGKQAGELERQVLDAIDVWVTIVDCGASVVLWNQAAERISGYSRDDIGWEDDLVALLHPDPDTRAQVIPQWNSALEARGPEDFTTAITSRSGQGATIEWQIRPLDDGRSGPGLRLIVGCDVTELAQREQQARPAEKMEAIGILAGGVAHGFNTMLTAIMGNAQLITTGAPEGGEIQEHAREILRASSRAADLTKQLLAFGRKQVLSMETLSANDVVSAAEPTQRAMIRDSIAVEIRPDESIGNVRADAILLEQALGNLALNARDAMPDGGEPVIATEAEELSDDDVRAHPELQAGPHGALMITHTGTGMDEETCSRVFDPFFTTRPEGAGTGLGLSTVYGIVRQMGGMIEVSSEPGVGTGFRIHIPLCEHEKQSARSAHGGATIMGEETVLIVEDEEMVRALMAVALTRFGFTALEATNRAQALELLSERGGDVDIIITDVVMPEMGGREFAEMAQDVAPETPVLFVSGYPGDRVNEDGIFGPGQHFLQKPFSATELGRKVREVIDRCRRNPEA